MNNYLKWGIAVAAVGIVGFLVWNGLRSPEAEQIDRNTQEILKKKCEIRPNSPDCDKLKP